MYRLICCSMVSLASARVPFECSSVTRLFGSAQRMVRFRMSDIDPSNSRVCWIEPVGQGSTQSPQNMHFASSMSNCVTTRCFGFAGSFSSVIWPCPTYNLEWWKQANKRQARIGQKEKTEVVTLIAPRTIEEKVYDMCMGKNARMSNLLDLFDVIHAPVSTKVARKLATA